MPLPINPLGQASEEPADKLHGANHLRKAIDPEEIMGDDFDDELDDSDSDDELDGLTLEPETFSTEDDSEFDDEYSPETPVDVASFSRHSMPTQRVIQTTDANGNLSDEIMQSVADLLSLIGDDECTEVLMNGPNEIMKKKNGARYHLPSIQFGDAETYHRIINEYILPLTDTKLRITGDSYLIEGQLEMPDEEDELSPPLLARVHIITPPVVKYAKVTIAKKARHSFSLDDIVARGTLTREMASFLKAASYGRLTTIFAGLSGAGKTTMLEACSHYFDQNDRIIVVEDTPELRLPIADVVYMTTSSLKPGMDVKDSISMEWLVRATNRMRPDRIIVGEVRGGEMSEFLIAANSGADGSMTTVHSADPRRTLDKILGLAMKSEGSKNEMSVRRDIAATVQLIVQITLIEGRHIVSHIEEVSTTIRQESGLIATNSLFEFDRSTGKHVVRGRPSDEMQGFLAQRGVNIEPTWFTNR